MTLLPIARRNDDAEDDEDDDNDDEDEDEDEDYKRRYVMLSWKRRKLSKCGQKCVDKRSFLLVLMTRQNFLACFPSAR